MGIDFNDPTDFEVIFRPNYEMKQVAVLVAGGLFYAVAPWFFSVPAEFLWLLSVVFWVFAFLRLPQALHIGRIHRCLLGKPLDCCTLEDLERLAKSDDRKDQMWLGKGFAWETKHTQRVHEILRTNWSSMVNDAKPNTFLNHITKNVPFSSRDSLSRGKTAQTVAENMGQPWIHGIEPNETDVWQKMKHVEGHTLIVGTTGSGKTRMFDLLISQAILRGEPVFIIDPKGDEDLKMNAKRACEALGRKDFFLVFDPAKIRESIRINPLANWTVATEIASRIMSLVPSLHQTADPFTSFSWDAVNKIVQGMVICNIPPTLKNIRSQVEVSDPTLLNRCIMRWATARLGETAAMTHFNKMGLSSRSDLSQEKNTKDLIRFYRTVLKENHGSSEIEGLISLYEHDQAHFGKMVASLIPALAKVTTGELGQLLSPSNDDESMGLHYFNFKELIRNNNVVYIALSSLRDSEVASAIGSMMLADLTSVAGSRYAYDPQRTPVNVFVDEASEVANDPLIQMLNKGRGAGFRLFIATQTFADFSVRLGKSDKAEQVLSNLNNIFALRTTNAATQEFLVSAFPKVKIKTIQRDQGQRLSKDNPLFSDATIGERLIEEETELIPQSLFGMLPNLEYFASVSGGNFIKGRVPILVKDRSEFKASS